MVELVDTCDLKSQGQNPCGFDSRHPDMEQLPPQLEDSDVIFKLAIEGNLQAQDAIISGYTRYVYGVASKMGTDKEELISEALVALVELVRKLPEIKHSDNLDGLIKIRIRGACLDYLGKKRCLVKCNIRDRVVRHSFQLSDTPEESKDFEEMLIIDELRNAFSSQQVLDLRMQGKTKVEIALATGISSTDVTRILQEAYEKWSQDHTP